MLLGLDQDDEGVLLEVDGARVTVPITAIARANLRYSFDGKIEVVRRMRGERRL